MELNPRQSQGGLDAPEAKADALTSFNKGILRQNWASRAFYDSVNEQDEINQGTDLSYSWQADKANEGYLPSTMLKATSSAHAAELRAQLDSEQDDLDIINSSGWGMAGELFGGVFRPEVLGAGFVGGSSIAGIVTAEMGAEVVNEAILHKQQETRTKEESYINIGMAGAGTAILAGAGKMISRKQLDSYVKGSQEETVDAAASMDKSAGAQEAGSTFEEEGMAGGVLPETLSIGPMARALQSPSKVLRVAIQKLADNPFITKGGEKGKTHGVSVESKTYSHLGRTVSVIDEIKLFSRESGLDAEDFEDQIGIAMKNDDTHMNPQVEKAAKLYREKVIEPIETDMVEMDMLPKLKGELQKELDDLTSQTEVPFNKASNQLEVINGRLAEIKKEIKTANPSRITELKAERKALKSEAEIPKRDLNEISKMRSRLSKQVDEAVPFRSKRGKSYFPAIYKQDLILEDYNKVKSILVDDLINQGDMARDEIEDFVVGRINRMMGRGTTNPVKRRSIAHLHDQLEPYMEKRASAVMLAHVRKITPQIELKKRFGQSLNGVVDDINADFQALIDGAPTEAVRKQLKKAQAEGVRDITRVWERVNNSVERHDPNTMSQKIIRRTKLFNISTQLGQITLSSLPDLSMPMFRYGFRSYAAGLQKASKQFFNDLDGLSKAQTQRTGAAVDRTLNQRLHSMSDSDDLGGKYEQLAGRMFSKVTLFDKWTDGMETVAAHASMDWTLRQGKKLAAGQRLSRSEMGQLSQMGLEHDRLIQMYQSSIKTGGGKDPILKFADTAKWEDSALAREFEEAIGSDVRRTILRVGDGEKPNMMDDALTSLVFMYTSFAISATNKLLVSGIQRRNMAVAQGLLASIALGSMVGMIKIKLRGENIDDMTAQDFLYEGLDRSGVAGLYRPALSAVQAATGHTPSRYLGREITGILGGATIGQVDRAISLVGNVVQGEGEKAAEDAARLTPFVSNTLGIRQMLLLLGDDK